MNKNILILIVICAVSESFFTINFGSFKRNNNLCAENSKAKTPKKLLDLVDFKRDKVAPDVPLAEDPMLPLVHSVALAADQRKANSINALRI